MKGMTVNERIEDIKRRTGYSENVIRSVLTAEAESALDSLKKGERVTLINRVSLIPQRDSKLDFEGNRHYFVTAKAKVLGSLNDKLAQYEKFENEDIEVEDSEDEGIVTTQIDALN